MSTDRPVITEEDARKAAGVLLRLIDGEDVDGALVAERAASSLLRLYQAQQRFSPAKIDKRAQGARPSQTMRTLSAMDPAELEKMRWEMAKDFPRKPS